VGKNVGIDLSQGRGFAAIREGNHNRGGNGSALEIAPDTAPGPLKESFLADQPLDVAVRKGREKAAELASLAIASLDVLPPSAAVDELRALARQVIERDH
jgi:geranylgeranyl pyrophosphate synthase